MASRKDEKFSMHVPKPEPEQQMPEHLELLDTARRRRLLGGAYDPYQKQDAPGPGDTARVRKPRVDLRKLSEWIKTTQRVKSQREQDRAASPPKGTPRNRK